MTCRLFKEIDSSLIPGTPSVPAIPASDGYYETITYTQVKYVASFGCAYSMSANAALPQPALGVSLHLPASDESLVQGLSQQGAFARTISTASVGGGGCIVPIQTTGRKQIYHQPTAYQPPVPGIPDTIEHYYDRGWNSSARSADSKTGDTVYQFSATGGAEGIASGLAPASSAESTDYTRIVDGFLLQDGRVYAILDGVVRGDLPNTVYTSKSVFRVERVGTEVRLLVDGQSLYTRNSPLFGKTVVAVSSFFTGGDEIYSSSWALAPGEIESAGELRPLHGVSFEDAQHYSHSEMAPLTGSAELAEVLVGVIDSEAEMRPLEGLSANYRYIMSAGQMVPISGSAQIGLWTPGIGNHSLGVMSPMIGASIVLTGGLIDSTGSMKRMAGLSADYKYIGSEGEMAPMYGEAYETPQVIAAMIAVYRRPTIQGWAESLLPTGMSAEYREPTIEAYGGAYAVMSHRRPVISASATNDSIAIGSMIYRRPTLTGLALVGGVASMSVVHSQRPTITAYGGAYGRLIHSKRPTLTAAVLSGNAVSGSMIYRSPTVTAIATVANFASGQIIYRPPISVWAAGSVVYRRQTIQAGAAVIIDPDDYVGYAVNIRHNSVTRYPAYPFDGIVQLNGTYYGVNASGLYEITGTNDDGADIDVVVGLPMSDMGSSHPKRAPRVYLEGETDGGFTVSAQADDLAIPEMPSLTAPGKGTHMAKMPRGPSAYYWLFTIRNVDGAALNINRIEVLAKELGRKL